MHAQFFHFCQHVDLSTCRPVTCDMAIYGVCFLLRGLGGLPPGIPLPDLVFPMIAHVLHACAILSLPSTCRPVSLSTCQSVNLSTSQLSTCQPVYLSICQPVDLSSCRPVTCNMAIYEVCILLQGSGALAPQAFRCESMPTPLNLTYMLPYDCPCFALMRNFFTDDLSTCKPAVDLSTCPLVDLSTFVGYYLCTIHLKCVISSYYS